ncbi:ubiquitin-like protein ISG15 [Aulostomus maculatus]
MRMQVWNSCQSVSSPHQPNVCHHKVGRKSPRRLKPPYLGRVDLKTHLTMSGFMEITVITLTESFTLLVNPGDTVKDLRELIQTRLNIPPVSQRLTLENGQKIPLDNDSAPLSYYGVHNGSHLALLVVVPPTIQVFLRNTAGQQSTYDIKSDETVDNFKQRVESRERVPASQQRLIYQGREMTSGMLTDYGVKALSTIELVLRLRGG